MYSLIRKILFMLDPETAHHFALRSMGFAYRLGILRTKVFKDEPIKVMGLKFPNRLGLAAGFDKNAKYIDPIGTLGFGFIEVGTVTPRPQIGNPRPRIFRQPKHESLVNFMGLNNEGVEAILPRLRSRSFQGIVGVSISQNTDTASEESINDYLHCFERVYPYADYITADISCPNVKTARTFFVGSGLNEFLQALKEKQGELKKLSGRYVPLLIKISPDIDNETIEAIATSVLKYKIDGVVATNTSKQRPGLEGDPAAPDRGGLSGKPIFNMSLNVVSQLHRHLGDKVPIIGVGGIMKPADALLLLTAGASLVQIYTGFIYQGPGLVKKIVKEIG